MESLYKENNYNMKNNDYIPWSKPHVWGNEKEYVQDALNSSWFSGGEYLNKLENSFAKLFDKKYVLLTSNGTTALHLIYLSLGFKEDDEIIIPGFAFMAAANIALQMKLKPVFAEVDPQTWCLTASTIEKNITSKTKAIVPIHTYGNVCPMDEIMQLAKRHNLLVIEDCAEALFSKYNNQYCGTFGHINCFSFQATKTITTGEGGLVVTDDETIYQKMKLYHSHGLKERGTYWHEVPGHNFRLTNLQAALGLAQLEKIETIIQERKRVFEKYRYFFSNLKEVELQKISPAAEPVWWAFAIKLHPKAFPQGRDGVIQELKARGIETRPGFVASSLLKIYEKHSLPVCETLSSQILSLPSYAGLKNEEMDRICQDFRKLIK
jgi:perosamine synthetase